MSEKCSICNSSIGGLMGMPKPTSELIYKANRLNIPHENICASCLVKKIKENTSLEDRYEDGSTELTEARISEFLKIMFVTPSIIPRDGTDFGIVTGYCSIGIGLMSEIGSNITSLFGAKSNMYVSKMETAEQQALNMMKFKALQKGANSIYNLKLALTEAATTNDRRMLMIYASGAAVAANIYDEKASKLFSEACATAKSLMIS